SLKAVHAPDVAEFFAVPRYRDYQAKMQIALRERESMDLVWLGSGDESERIVSKSDPSRLRRASTSQGFERFYLRYRRSLADGAQLQVVPWVGRDTSRYDASFGRNPAQLEQRAFRFGVRAEHRSHLAANLLLSLGADIAGARAQIDRRGSLTIPAREGDRTIFGQPPGDDSNVDSWQTTLLDLAPYATLDWELGPLTFTPGLRIAGYLLESSRNTPRIGQTPSIGQASLRAEIEPRMSVRFRLSRRVELFAALGAYSQAPAAQDLSAVFGTPRLGLETALHASVGESVELAARLSLSVTGFYRSLSNLAVRDPSPTPKLAGALLDSGVGDSYGVQVLLQQRPWDGFVGSLAYTASRSERRDTPESRVRLFDADQSHVLTAQGSQSLAAWTLGARLRYASGAPRTPVIGGFFDEKNDTQQPILGALNGQRLPSFWQLDLRLDRKFRLAKDAILLAYLELLNVTNHANAEEFVYSQDYARRGLVTGMPFLAVFGLRLEL
ncbi:MAG TPA: TonB-dependent receptor, partial [Polyangiaceae bacterium]